MFDTQAAKKAGATDEQIAEFLTKKFNHPGGINPQETIDKLSGLDAEDAKKSKENDELDEALEEIADVHQDENGLFPFPKARFKACLKEHASEKIVEDITSFTDNIKLVEKPSQLLVKQLMALTKNPMGQFLIFHLDKDEDLDEDVLNPFFSIKIVNSARHIKGQDKQLLSLLKSTKGKLNSLIINTALNAIINEYRPKYMKMQIEKMQQKAQSAGEGGPEDQAPQAPAGPASPQQPPVQQMQPPQGMQGLIGAR